MRTLTKFLLLTGAATVAAAVLVRKVYEDDDARTNGVALMTVDELGAAWAKLSYQVAASDVPAAIKSTVAAARAKFEAWVVSLGEDTESPLENELAAQTGAYEQTRFLASQANKFQPLVTAKT